MARVVSVVPKLSPMSLRSLVVTTVVGACLAVPTALVGASAWASQRQAVDAQIDRGQQMAVTAATLLTVARQSGSSADRALFEQFLRAVVTGDVAWVVVLDESGAVDAAIVGEGVAAGAGDAKALAQATPDGVVAVDAAVVGRDRNSRAEFPAGRVVVGLKKAPLGAGGIAVVAVVAFFVVAIAVALLLWLFERRLVRPLRTVARALDDVAAGKGADVENAVEVVAPAEEVRAVVDGYHALVRALRDKGALQASLTRATGAQVDVAALDAPPVTAQVSVLFVDIRDFTPLTAALSPEQTVAFLDGVLSAFVDVVHRHEGHVERFLGDGLVAVWGAPRAAPDHAARAVAAAVDLEARAAVLSRRAREDGIPGFVVGVGVASGSAVTGGVGPSSRRFFAVTGEVPATARRIQQEAKSQGLTVLVTEQTFAACQGAVVDVVWKKTPPMVVRGIGVPLTLYRPQKQRADAAGDVTDRIRR